MIFKHFLATPFLLFSLATGYAAHHDGDAFGDRPSSSSFAAPSSTASSCAASSCAAPSFAAPSSTTSSLKSALTNLFSVPKTFLQSFYMSPDEINAGTVTTAQKLKTGLSDLTRAAKTFEPMALADPLTHAAENLAQVALTGVQTFNTLSKSQKVLFAATVGLAVLQTVDAATVYAPPSPVTYYRYERSLQDICKSQRFDFGNLECYSRVDDVSGLCHHTIECTIPTFSIPPKHVTEDIIVLPPVSNITIDASADTGHYFPLKMEDCGAMRPLLRQFHHENVTYEAFYSCNRFTTELNSLYPIPEAGMCSIGYQGEGMQYLYRQDMCAPWQDRNWFNCNYNIIGRLPPVVYKNGTSIYGLSQTHTVTQCVERDNPASCISLVSKIPALVVEIGGKKALYPYSNEGERTGNGGIVHPALYGPSAKNTPWEKYDGEFDPLLDIV